VQSTNPTYTIGIDAGTTSIKGILLSEKGVIMACKSHEYKLDTGPEDICEVDPEIYWELTCKIIRQLISVTRVNPELIKGIAISSQGETLIVVDKNGMPIRKAIVWLDNRSIKEARLITEKFGIQQIMNITGLPEVQPIWPATRILWFKNNEPQTFIKVGKYLMVEDFLIFRLTGKYFTDYSLVSDSLYFDISKKVWWDEMLDFLEISADKLPELLQSGKAVGQLTSEACRATGLTDKTTCITGAYDHAAGAIGAGNDSPGILTISIGTSMAMCVTLNSKVTDVSLKLPCQCHALSDLYFLLPYAQTAGLVLKWFRDEFCAEEIAKSLNENEDPYDRIIALAEQIPPGSDGLMMLPHFMGTGSPNFNSNVRGVYAGITPGMGKGHFVRAILEAVVCDIEHNLETMRNHQIEIKEIRLLGGASKSQLWCQILADLSGIPVVTISQTENAALGSAILAGFGTGIFPDIASACKICITIDKKFIPQSGNYEIYRKVFENFMLLYSSLEEYWVKTSHSID
jgi:xylulokinase